MYKTEFQSTSSQKQLLLRLVGVLMLLCMATTAALMSTLAVGANFGTLLDRSQNHQSGNPESCAYKRSEAIRHLQHPQSTCINAVGQKEWVFYGTTNTGHPHDPVRYMQSVNAVTQSDFTWFPFGQLRNLAVPITQQNIELVDCTNWCSRLGDGCAAINYHREARYCELFAFGITSKDELTYNVEGTPADFFQKKFLDLASDTYGRIKPKPSQFGACGLALNSQNQWQGGRLTVSPDDITAAVCSKDQSSIASAHCFQYVMAGNVPWDRNGNANWAELNAARLCAGTPVYNLTTSCFQGLIIAGKSFPIAIESCRIK